MKYLPLILSAFLVSGCQNALVSTKTIDRDGNPVVVNQTMSQKNLLAQTMNDNVQKCLDSSIAKFNADKERAIADQKPKETIIRDGEDLGTNETALALVDRVLDYAEKLDENRTKVDMARLGKPFTTNELPHCAKLGFTHMVVEKKKINHATLNNLVGKGLNLLKVFGYTYAGAKVALDIADKLAEPKITSGPDSTNILGDRNNYQPDNRDNSCLQDGSCVTPPEEMMEETGEEIMPDPEEVGELPAPEESVDP